MIEIEAISISVINRKSKNLLGGVAQLGERLPCTQEVIGSNPFTSTMIRTSWIVGSE